MIIKLKWKVASVPTGRYRSFEYRGWPDATYADGKPAVQIRCKDDYTAQRAKGEDEHAELTVYIADHHPKAEWKDRGAFTWRTLKARYKTLAEAKEAAQAFINQFTMVHPKD